MTTSKIAVGAPITSVKEMLDSLDLSHREKLLVLRTMFPARKKTLVLGKKEMKEEKEFVRIKKLLGL
jgi:hypothetical protein